MYVNSVTSDTKAYFTGQQCDCLKDLLFSMENIEDFSAVNNNVASCSRNFQ